MLQNIIKVSSSRVPYESVVATSRCLITQAQPKADATASEVARDPEWANALPYSEIPRPSRFTMLRAFGPGGRYYNVNLPQLHRLLREDFGDLVRLPGMFGRYDLLMSYNPDDYEKLYRTEGPHPFRRFMDSFIHYRMKVRPDVFKGMAGLASAQGEHWQQFRSVVNPVMIQPAVAKLYIGKMDDITREFMKKMLSIRDEKSELPADFSQWLNRWALEMMGVLALDTRLRVLDSSETKEMGVVDDVRELFELLFQLDILPSIWKYVRTPKFNKLMKVLDHLTNLVMTKVDEAVIRLEENPTDNANRSVLEKLLKVNRDVAVVMAFDMLLSGVDTTSSGTIGIFYCLAKNPDKQARLREELRKVLPNKDSPLTPENMRNLPYLRACIKEGLRLVPPVIGTARGAGADIVLQGYQVPKGTEVTLASMGIQQEERYFTRGSEFLPERWLKDSGCPSGKDAHPFLFLPFGFGPRTCIGKRFAMMEMEIFIARVTRLFEYRWNYDELRIRGTLVNVVDNDLKFQMTEVED